MTLTATACLLYDQEINDLTDALLEEHQRANAAERDSHDMRNRYQIAESRLHEKETKIRIAIEMCDGLITRGADGNNMLACVRNILVSQ